MNEGMVEVFNGGLLRVALLAAGAALSGYAVVRSFDPSQRRLLRKQWAAFRCWLHDWRPMRNKPARFACIDAHVQGFNEGFAEGRRVGRESALSTISRLPYQGRRQA